MLNQSVFYHQTLRNIIIAFGNLFSDIYIARRNTVGVIEQTIAVPIAYSQKEKWIQSIEQNPQGTKGTYVSLPRLAFELTGLSYDSARKLARMNEIRKIDNTITPRSERVFMPVPYTLTLSLNFATKTQEDGFQILEQILPVFTPEYTLAINTIPEMDIVQDVPFILDSVAVSDDYEGDLATRRFVIHTLSFTAKINFFRNVNTSRQIQRVEVDVATRNRPERSYLATQETPAAPINERWFDSLDL